MIFLGDIASPTEATTQDLERFFKINKSIFQGESLIVNLEGLLGDTALLRTKTPLLFNHPTVAAILKRAGVRVAALANNHTLDIPHQFPWTKETLQREGILFVGAGTTQEEVEGPLFFQDGGRQVILFNCCWSFLLYHQRNPTNGVRVNEIIEQPLLNAVKKHKKLYPDASIVLFFHWSFDLETLPFPMYRQFSMDLIDAGAELVVGCHSHCVQGGERYKAGYVLYGLGNCFLPHGLFADGHLDFPIWSNEQLVLQWNPTTKKATCHWFTYEKRNQTHELNFIESRPFDDCKRLSGFSPYQGMDHKTYETYYRLNRRKKKFIPLFRTYNATMENKLKMMFLKTRANVARLFASLGIIKWQN